MPKQAEHLWDFTSWEDTDLTKEWNRLETLRASAYNENKADAIAAECQTRRIIAWDKDGNVTQRD